MSDNLQVELSGDTSEHLGITVSEENIANVNIEFDISELVPYKKQFIETKRKNVVLRGYRKGTAPINMVAKFFAEEAKESAQNSILYAKYIKLMQEHKLQPLAQPRLEKMSENINKINAKLVVEVLQPVVLNQYLGLNIQQKTSLTSIDEAIKTVLSDLKTAYPKLVTSDIAIANNVVANVTFGIFIDDKEFENQKDLQIIIGSNLYYPEFEQNLIGLKSGDSKEFNIVFPSTYANEGLRDKHANFKLYVNNISMVEQYTDDELAVVLKFENKDAMLLQLTNEANNKNKELEFAYFEEQILKQLLDSHTFKVPKSLIDTEINKILSEKRDIDVNQAHSMAETFVKTDLILNAIYERHPDIHLTEEMFQEKISSLAVKAKEEVSVVISKLQSAGKLQSYINYLKNCKVIEFLIDVSNKIEINTNISIEESGE